METACDAQTHWFAMRDLKRPNAKLPAYKQLSQAGFQVFTPLTPKITTIAGKRTRVQVPFVPDLLFVRSDKESLDHVVARTQTLQYRFVKGAPYGTPMIVPARDMDRFIAAVSRANTPRYYAPDEITPGMYGAKVRMVCEGPLCGFEGKLLKIKGSGKKRFLIELPGLLTASIEVTASDYIELLHP